MGNPIVTLSVMSRDPVRSSYDPHMLTAQYLETAVGSI